MHSFTDNLLIYLFGIRYWRALDRQSILTACSANASQPIGNQFRGHFKIDLCSNSVGRSALLTPTKMFVQWLLLSHRCKASSEPRKGNRREKMSIDFDSSEFNVNGKCAPRNALFCCRSPICLNNNSPKLVPPTSASAAAMDSANVSPVHPVRVPDLSDPMFYTNLMSQPTPDMTASTKPMAINKSQSAQDIRHGVSLRRVTPPKCTVTVKKCDAPSMGVVLRKVEKKLLEPPKPAKHEQSPPPRKLTSAATAIGLTTPKTSKATTSAATSASAKSKKPNNPSANQSAAIAKSKSTNDVHGKPPKDKATTVTALPTCASAVDLKPPPVNLLKAHRPPLEIHKIEGDKIIIIRRVPRSHRGAGQPPKSARSLPSLPLPSDQVTNCRHPISLTPFAMRN